MGYRAVGRTRLALIGALAVVGGCASAPQPQDSIIESSSLPIIRDSRVIGARERVVYAIDGGRQIVSTQTIQVSFPNSRPRKLVEQNTRTEDSEKNTLSVEQRSRFGGYETVTRAEIANGEALIRRDARGETRETTIDLPDGLRFDNGAGLLAEWNPNETPRLAFFALDIQAPHIETVVYRFANHDGPDGERQLQRLSYVDGQLRSLTRISLDETGGLLSADQAMLGSSLQTDTTVDAAIGATSNPVRDSLIKSPYRISSKTMQGHIRYTFRLNEDVDFVPPQTSEQRVTALPDGFVLDICNTCGDGLDTSDEYLEDALRPTFWLQSDHPRMMRFAKETGQRDETDTQKMERLERWARRRMKDIDFIGHYSAAEALGRRSGDCTEGAVVLAALGRAAGIPTRVASGIVYSRERYHGVSHAFMPHAWTLAYVDGKWQSFDMSLDGFDATHIALTISDGDPGSVVAAHQLAALLQWDGITEVRKRPLGD